MKKLRMKIRQKFKFTATATILAFGGVNKGYTQNISQAVMGVQVTIISGSQYTNNTISDISDQIENHNSRVSFGNIKIQPTDGMDYIIKQPESIKMIGENSNWIINTNMSKKRNSDGQITIQMSGDTLSHVPEGKFEGRHITEINYLY